MSTSCDIARSEVGNGVAASLRAVDCISAEMTQAAFGRLFGAGGALGSALTIVLTLYVAFFAISLLTGRSRLGISAVTPRMMTLGLVLTFATSWVAYQSVVWNLAVGAPDQIASAIAGGGESATRVFGDKIDIVFATIAEATKGQAAAPTAVSTGTFTPPNLIWLGATLLLLGTVGVLITARIAMAVLVAIGPIFVVFALFDGSRGLFAGWLRGMVMLALAPLFTVLAGSLMLEMAVPIIARLAEPTGQIDPRAAMAFFLVGAVHVALMAMVFRTTGTMVGSWSVFGLAPSGLQQASGQDNKAATNLHAPAAQTNSEPPRTLALQPGRALTASIASSETHNATGRMSGGTQRDPAVGITRASMQTAGRGTSRSRGIGNRYRAPNQNRFLEKSR